MTLWERSPAGGPTLIAVSAVPAFLALLLLSRIFFFAGAGVSRITWPWQMEYGEGVNLDAVCLLSQGYNIYSHNGPRGFISAPYPPFLYVLTLPFEWLFGPTFTAGRAIAFISTLLCAALIAYVVWKVAGIGTDISRDTSTSEGEKSMDVRLLSIPSALLAAALWLSLSPVIVWSAFFRQDLPSLCLELAGLAVVLRIRNSEFGIRNNDRSEHSAFPRALEAQRLGSSLVAILFFTLAFYTKQSSVAAAAAASIWLILRDWRFGLRFVLLLGVAILLPFITVDLLSQGGLTEHLIGYHSVPFSQKRFMDSIDLLLSEYWPTLLIASVALGLVVVGALTTRNRPAAGRLMRWGRSPSFVLRGAPIVLLALLGWSTTIATVGVEGSIFNHLLDGLLPSCILVGLAAYYPIHWLVHWRPSLRTRLASLSLMGLFSAAFVVQVFSFESPLTWLPASWPNEARDGELQGISHIVSQTPGDIFSEDSGILLSNGKRPIYDDAGTFVPLARLGKWDDSGLNQSLLDRRFAMILLYQGGGRWTRDGQKAFSDSYNLKFRGSMELYEPKLFPDSAQYSLTCNLTHAGDSVALTGYSLPPGVAENGVVPDDVLRVQLLWRADKPIKGSYATYVHLLTDKGDFTAGQDNPQTGATKPTNKWAPGQIVTDTASLPLHNLSEGRYRLIAGMYAFDNGALSNFTDACKVGQTYAGAVSLGWVDVKRPSGRRPSPPEGSSMASR